MLLCRCHFLNSIWWFGPSQISDKSTEKLPAGGLLLVGQRDPWPVQIENKIWDNLNHCFSHSTSHVLKPKSSYSTIQCNFVWLHTTLNITPLRSTAHIVNVLLPKSLAVFISFSEQQNQLFFKWASPWSRKMASACTGERKDRMKFWVLLSYPLFKTKIPGLFVRCSGIIC